MTIVSAPAHDAAPGVALARGAGVNLLALAASNFRGLFTLSIAWLMGSEALGIFALSWTATDLIATVAMLGLDSALLTKIPRQMALNDAAGARSIWRHATRLALAVSVAAAAAGAPLVLFLPGIGTGVRADLATPMALMLVAVPGVVLYRVSNAASRGMKVMHHDLYSRGLAEWTVSLVVFLGAWASGAGRLAPSWAVVAGGTASGVTAFLLARRLFAPERSTRPAVGAGTSAPYPMTQLLGDSLPIAAYTLINNLIMRLDVLMLGAYVGRAPGLTLETLGIYAAAVEVAGGLRKVNQAFNPIFIPIVSAQGARGDREGMQESYGYLGRWMLAVLLPSVAVLALAGSAIMSIFGPGFDRGAVWLAIVGAASALNVFAGAGESLIMIERPSLNVLNSSSACLAAVVAGWWLIPELGPAGAAIAQLVPYALLAVLRHVELRTFFAWEWQWRPLMRPLVAVLLALPIALLVRMLVEGDRAGIAAAILFVAAYLGAWRVLGLEAQDRLVIGGFRGTPSLQVER